MLMKISECMYLDFEDISSIAINNFNEDTNDCIINIYFKTGKMYNFNCVENEVNNLRNELDKYYNYSISEKI